MPIYRSPFGRYARGAGIYPGQRGMGDVFGPSLIRSPTGPGSTKSPTLKASGATNAATSQTPTSILNGGKQYFGPLAYSTRDQDQEIPSQRAPKRRK